MRNGTRVLVSAPEPAAGGLVVSTATVIEVLDERPSSASNEAVGGGDSPLPWVSVMVDGALEAQSYPSAACHVLPANWASQAVNCGDLTQLPVSAPSPAYPLRSLEERYVANRPYTKLGDTTLVYLNPFIRLPPVPASSGAPHRPPQPSPQELASMALERLLYGKNENDAPYKRVAFAVTGISGAGKTMALSFALEAILAKLSPTGQQGGDIRDHGSIRRLARAAPALELFGNASTRHNANSSRFVKQVSLFIVDGEDVDGHRQQVATLEGMRLTASLLEVSRVVERATGEGPFHVIRMLFTSLPPAEKRRLDLWDPAMFRLAHQHEGTLPPLPWTFDDLQQSLRAVGISKADETCMWEVLAAIMHLGNTEFDASDDFAPVSVRKLDCVNKVAGLLGVGVDTLVETLTSVQLGPVRRQLHREAATRVRDTMCRDLYSLLFDFIVARCNSTPSSPALDDEVGGASSSAASPVTPASIGLPPKPNSAASLMERAMRGLQRAKAVSAEASQQADNTSSSVSPISSPLLSQLGPLNVFTPSPAAKELVMADIFGFEDMVPDHANSLEQLLINFTNEAFQALYTSSALGSQTDLLASEGVELPQHLVGSKIAMTARDKEVLNTFTSRSKPVGILKLIADDAALGQQHGSQQGEILVGKIISGLGPRTPADPHVVSRPPILRADEFIVGHFAGNVKYCASGFAAKDRINASVFASLVSKIPGSMFVAAVGAQVAAFNAAQGAGGAGFVTSSSDPQGLAGKSQSARFSIYLEQLTNYLGGSNALFWVRCIKPNPASQPTHFDAPYVSRQLAACGVFRAYLLATTGYAHSVSHRDFAMNFIRPIALQRGHESASAAELQALLDRCRFHECCSRFLDGSSGGLLTQVCTLRHSYEVAVGSSRVFLMAEAFAAVTLAAHGATVAAAEHMARVGRAYLKRRSLVPLYEQLRRRRVEQAVRARMDAEAPIRAALEMERAGLFRGDASSRDELLVDTVLPSLVRSRKVNDKIKRVVAAVQSELQRAFRELQQLEEMRMRVERSVRTELDERAKMAERKLEERKRAAAQSAAFEERRHIREQREAAARERAAARRPLPPDREAAVLSKIHASQRMRMQSEKDAAKSFYSGLAAESERTQVHIVSRHVGAAVDQLVANQRSRSSVGERAALTQDMLLDGAIRDSYRTMERVRQLHHSEYQRQRQQEDEHRKGRVGHGGSINTLLTKADQFPLPLPADIRMSKGDHFAVAARSHSARFVVAERERNARLDAHRHRVAKRSDPLSGVSRLVVDSFDESEHWEDLREAWAMREEVPI